MTTPDQAVEVIGALACILQDCGLKGAGTTNLKQCRAFCLLHKTISQTASDLFPFNRIGPTVSGQLPASKLKQTAKSDHEGHQS